MLYKEVLDGLEKEADGGSLDDLKKTRERVEIMEKLIEDVENATKIAENIQNVLTNNSPLKN